MHFVCLNHACTNHWQNPLRSLGKGPGAYGGAGPLRRPRSSRAACRGPRVGHAAVVQLLHGRGQAGPPRLQHALRPQVEVVPAVLGTEAQEAPVLQPADDSIRSAGRVRGDLRLRAPGAVPRVVTVHLIPEVAVRGHVGRHRVEAVLGVRLVPPPATPGGSRLHRTWRRLSNRRCRCRRCRGAGLRVRCW